MKEFQGSFNALIDALPDGYTSANIGWSKDGINYSISLTASGGSSTAYFSAYKPTPVPAPAATGTTGIALVPTADPAPVAA